MVVCRYTLEDDFDLKEKRVVFRPVVIDMLDVITIPVREVDGSTSRVDCWMEITKGRFPQTSPIDSAVKVGSPLTLAIFVRDPRKRTDLRVKDCYAYDDPQVAESNGPALLQLTDFDGCPTKPKLIEVWRRTHDAGPTGATIIAFTTVTAFKFPDRPDLQLTCNIELCRNQCSQRCSSEMPGPVSIGTWTREIEDGFVTSRPVSERPVTQTTVESEDEDNENAAGDGETEGGGGAEETTTTEASGGDEEGGEEGGDAETTTTTDASEGEGEGGSEEGGEEGGEEATTTTEASESEGGGEEGGDGGDEGGEEATTTTEASESEGGGEEGGDGESEEATTAASDSEEEGESGGEETTTTEASEESEESDSNEGDSEGESEATTAAAESEGDSEGDGDSETTEASESEATEESDSESTSEESSEENNTDEEAEESSARIKEIPPKKTKSKPKTETKSKQKAKITTTTTTTTTTTPSTTTTTKKPKSAKKSKSKSKTTTPTPKAPKSAAQVRPNDAINSIVDQIHWSTSTLRPLRELMDAIPKSKSSVQSSKKSKKSTTTTTTTTTPSTTTTTTTTTQPTTKSSKKSKKSSNRKSTTTPTTTAKPTNQVRKARAPSSSHPEEFPHLHILEDRKRLLSSMRSNPFYKFRSQSQTKETTTSAPFAYNMSTIVITEVYSPNSTTTTTIRPIIRTFSLRNNRLNRPEPQSTRSESKNNENPIIIRRQSLRRRSDVSENPNFEAFNNFQRFQAMRIRQPNHRVVRSVELRYSDPNSQTVIFHTKIHSAIQVI